MKLRDLVIPVQAGFHPRLWLGAIGEMDPCLRGDDRFVLRHSSGAQGEPVTV